MATLIPAYSTCTGRMQTGERRLALRLEAKLEEDYLCWFNANRREVKHHVENC